MLLKKNLLIFFYGIRMWGRSRPTIRMEQRRSI